MTEQVAGRTVPQLPGLIAGGLVILGLVLDTFVAEGLLVVAGLGAFGPGILRELGWLRDKDEFQRQAAYRAGYHAYLIGGLATVLIVSALRWPETNLENSSEWTMLVLVILWMTWLFSALLAYWGARKTASRVLLTFGSFWAVFIMAMVVGALGSPEGVQLVGVLMAFVFVAPFFVLAFTAGRWPRPTGFVLLAVPAFFLVLVAPGWAARSLEWSSILVTAMLLLVPLIASGIALLRSGDSDGLDSGEPDDNGVPLTAGG